MNDTLVGGSNIFCQSSADMTILDQDIYDLVITDPPFGNNLFYADLGRLFLCLVAHPDAEMV